MYTYIMCITHAAVLGAYFTTCTLINYVAHYDMFLLSFHNSIIHRVAYALNTVQGNNYVPILTL